MLTFNPVYRVFLDDKDLQGVRGGKVYSDYGVSSDGAAVVVRPDGFVGFVAPLDCAKDLNTYFSAFLRPS